MFIGVDILPCLAELQWNVILEYNIQVIWNLNTQLIVFGLWTLKDFFSSVFCLLPFMNQMTG